MNKFIKLLVSLGVCLGAGFIGSVFTRQSVTTWYQTINKPSFNPPDWIFAPVWTTLFILMGIALFLIWQKGFTEKDNKVALYIFVLQLIFNMMWSLAFFGLRSPFLGVVVIVVLWVLILLTILKFFKISKLAGWLLIPYILWVSFASVLNFSIWQLNP